MIRNIYICQNTVSFRPVITSSAYILFPSEFSWLFEYRRDADAKEKRKKKALGAFPANDFAYPCSSAIYAFLSPPRLPPSLGSSFSEQPLAF